MNPNAGRWLTGYDLEEEANDGTKKNELIINSTPAQSIRDLAAGMMSNMSSPSRPWILLGLADRELEAFGPVKQWLRDVRDIILAYFERSNLYLAIHEMYSELATFGTNAFLISQDMKYGINVMPFTIGEFFLSCDGQGKVNTLFRHFAYTARQLVDMFGINEVSRRIREAYTTGKGERRFTVVHAIQPYMPDDPALLENGRYPWESVYFEEKCYDSHDEDRLLSRGGYLSMPFVAPRWRVKGTDVYGTSPGMDALGDIKMLQKMEEKGLRALDKWIDPPVNAPATMKNDVPSLMAGGLNYFDGQTQGLRPVHEVTPNPQGMDVAIGRVEDRIRRAFFNDLFLTLLYETKRMTATEVAHRQEEKLILLGPVLDRLHSEALNVLIERAYYVLERMGAFPPPPIEANGQPLRVEYISTLAQAQKLVGTGAIERFAGFVGNMAAADVTVLDVANFDETVREYAVNTGVAPKLIRSREEVEQIRMARAQMQAQQAQMEQATLAAQNAKVLADTPLGDGTALDAIVGGS